MSLMKKIAGRLMLFGSPVSEYILLSWILSSRSETGFYGSIIDSGYREIIIIVTHCPCVHHGNISNHHLLKIWDDISISMIYGDYWIWNHIWSHKIRYRIIIIVVVVVVVVVVKYDVELGFTGISF